ncbi:MAG: 30S ribosomal protein S4 [Thermodesulfobacteriota bacterium]
MARHTESVCRICRRENLKLFLKGERCYTEKCAYDRRSYPPGQHGQARKKFSDYGTQLREKQKVKRMYGVLENQFRNIFKEADRQKGITGETLLSLLERRLDNIIYRLGFANSRNEARQLVRHKHFLVNQSKVSIPSYLVKPGDVIELREKSKKVVRILEALEGVARRGVPQWLELDKDQMKGSVKGLPNREEITIPIQEKLIVELFSK